MQAEHADDVVQLQQKYKLEIDLLKDQLLESDARNESLEQEVKQKFFSDNKNDSNDCREFSHIFHLFVVT